jgi:hypothetical protein
MESVPVSGDAVAVSIAGSGAVAGGASAVVAGGAAHADMISARQRGIKVRIVIAMWEILLF